MKARAYLSDATLVPACAQPVLVYWARVAPRTQNLTHIFKKHFNKSVGSTLLRHIVLTEKFGKQLQDMELMADMMAHTVSTAHNIYIKNVDNDSSDECSE